MSLSTSSPSIWWKRLFLRALTDSQRYTLPGATTLMGGFEVSISWTWCAWCLASQYYVWSNFCVKSILHVTRRVVLRDVEHVKVEVFCFNLGWVFIMHNGKTHSLKNFYNLIHCLCQRVDFAVWCKRTGRVTSILSFSSFSFNSFW